MKDQEIVIAADDCIGFGFKCQGKENVITWIAAGGSKLGRVETRHDKNPEAYFNHGHEVAASFGIQVAIELGTSQDTTQFRDCFPACTDRTILQRPSQHAVRNRAGSKGSADKSAVVDDDAQFQRSS